MRSFIRILDNDEGSVLLLALFILIAITALGMFSTTTSTIENQVTANNAAYKRAFYAAEAGLEHARVAIMNMPEVDGARTFPDSLLAGVDPDGAPNDPTNHSVWVEDEPFGDGLKYTVLIYDDYDEPPDEEQRPHVDEAPSQLMGGRIYVRSIGEDEFGSTAILETILMLGTDEEPVYDYTAQAGAGAAHQSEGQDREAAKSHTLQTQI